MRELLYSQGQGPRFNLGREQLAGAGPGGKRCRAKSAHPCRVRDAQDWVQQRADERGAREAPGRAVVLKHLGSRRRLGQQSRCAVALKLGSLQMPLLPPQMPLLLSRRAHQRGCAAHEQRDSEEPIAWSSSGYRAMQLRNCYAAAWEQSKEKLGGERDQERPNDDTS